MDISEQALRQLRWIKWLTALLALSFAAIAVTFIWFAQQMSSSFESARESSGFSERAYALLEAGKLPEVLALCDEHEKKSPNDPYLGWYRGSVYYQLGRLPEALAAMRQAEAKAPYWRQEYTGPFIQAIEKDLSKKNR